MFEVKPTTDYDGGCSVCPPKRTGASSFRSVPAKAKVVIDLGGTPHFIHEFRFCEEHLTCFLADASEAILARVE